MKYQEKLLRPVYIFFTKTEAKALLTGLSAFFAFYPSPSQAEAVGSHVIYFEGAYQIQISGGPIHSLHLKNLPQGALEGSKFEAFSPLWKIDRATGTFTYSLSKDVKIAEGERFSVQLLPKWNESFTLTSVNVFYDLKYDPTHYMSTVQVPEPGTNAIFLTGLGLMGLLARRRRSS